MKTYCIEIKDVGKEPLVLSVYDKNIKRVAIFSTLHDAEEACRLIEKLRIDTAFEWAKPC